MIGRVPGGVLPVRPVPPRRGVLRWNLDYGCLDSRSLRPHTVVRELGHTRISIIDR